jgi:hypothetical protein
MRLREAMVGPHGGSARLQSEWAGAYLHVTLEAQLAQLRHEHLDYEVTLLPTQADDERTCSAESVPALYYVSRHEWTGYGKMAPGYRMRACDLRRARALCMSLKHDEMKSLSSRCSANAMAAYCTCNTRLATNV